MNLFSSMSNIGLEEFIEDPSKQFRNAVFANGIWQKRKVPVGEFTIQVEKFDGKTYGLTKECSFDFTFSLPKIPITILHNILALYREVSGKFQAEVYVSLYWDRVKQDYFLHVPKQKVSGASVTFENEPEMLNNPDYVIVMDSHSHVNMSAFWSAQDIKDQKASRLFSVLGRVNSDKPEILLTAGANQQEKRLQIVDVFDLTLEKLHEHSDYTISEALKENIQKHVYTTTPITDYGSYGNKKTTGVAPKPATTTPAKPVTPSYYNQPQQVLQRAISSYFSSYSLSSMKIQELVTAFIDYLDDEAFKKDVTYSQDLEHMEEVLGNLLSEMGKLFDDILDTYDLRENKKEEAQEAIASEDPLEHLYDEQGSITLDKFFSQEKSEKQEPQNLIEVLQPKQ